MQSLGLLRPIEKFAEIHRQVSLRSLTAVGLGVPTCLFRLEPVSIAECFAFCSETAFLPIGVTLDCRPDLLGDFIPKPHLRFAAVLMRFLEVKFEQAMKKQ